MKAQNPSKDPARQERLLTMLTSPALFLRDLDPLRGIATFTPMSEESYRDSAFLDNRIQRAGPRDIAIDLDDLLDLVQARPRRRRPIHYIFHIGHCGSTLLSRILGARKRFLALREPPLLMGLSRSMRALDRPGFPISRERWESLLALSLWMLSKTWQPEQTVLIKPTSQAGRLIPVLMDYTGLEKAVLLYVDLETHLPMILRPHTRRETQLFAADYAVREFSDLAPGYPDSPDQYSVAQLAVMSWLLHVRELADITSQASTAARVLPLHFEAFLRQPGDVVVEICRFFDQPVRHGELERLVSPDLLQRAAKNTDQSYGQDHRQQEIKTAQIRYRKEIEEGLAWADRVCTLPAFRGLRERFSRASGLTAQS
ncbi:MAG: hypothetical protein JSW21_09800 [Gammaproteobacteria bacterium]|nr:MAG: hypothetical protein JSW21_09800 [Gammaproteobacteria bacterium]